MPTAICTLERVWGQGQIRGDGWWRTRRGAQLVELDKLNFAAEEATGEEAVQHRRGVWWESARIQADHWEKQQMLNKQNIKYLHKYFQRQRGGNLIFFCTYMKRNGWRRAIGWKMDQYLSPCLFPDYKRISSYVGFKIILRIWIGSQRQKPAMQNS